MSFIGTELRLARRENARLNRKLSLQRISGKVVQRDASTRKVRLEIGEDPSSGEKILSPWIRVQSTSAGAFKGFVLPSVGEQLYMESPSGVVGADSLATFGAFDDEHKHPQQEADQQVFENGDTRISMKNGELRLAVGGSVITMTAGEITLAQDGSVITITGGDIRIKSGKIVTEGDTFLGGEGGVPASKEGTLDTGGFADIQNLAKKVFIT